MSLIPKMLVGAVLIALFVNPNVAVALAPTETKGTVLAVFPDRQALMVTDDNGGNITFVLDYQGKVIMDQRPAKLEDLLPGDHVRVLHDTQGERQVASEIHCRRDTQGIGDRPLGQD
jgi:hypothetical protein